MIHPSLSTILLLFVVALAACAHEPVSQRSNASARLGPRLAERWSYALGAGDEVVRVYAASPCVLLESWRDSRKTAGEASTGRLRCLDPEDGHLRWEQALPTEAPQGASFVLLAGPIAVVAQGTRVVALELESGEERWSFETGERLVRGAELVEGLLLVDLNHEVLALVEVEDGVWRGGLGLEGRALEFALRDAGGGLAVLSGRGAKGGEALLGAASLEVSGLASEPPWAPLALLWERRTTLQTWSAQLVGDAVVAHLEGERLEILDPRSGEALQVEEVPALSARAGKPGRPGWARVGRSADPYASLEDDLRPRLLPRGAHPLLIAGPELTLQTPEPGLMLETLVLQGRSPRDLRVRWTLSLALPELITRRAELPEAGAFVLASQHHLLFLDGATGQLIHHTRLSKRRAGWRDIATDGRAIYLLFTRGKKPRLEAWPR